LACQCWTVLLKPLGFIRLPNNKLGKLLWADNERAVAIVLCSLEHLAEEALKSSALYPSRGGQVVGPSKGVELGKERLVEQVADDDLASGDLRAVPEVLALHNPDLTNIAISVSEGSKGHGDVFTSRRTIINAEGEVHTCGQFIATHRQGAGQASL
jgi:hypothetical protein